MNHRNLLPFLFAATPLLTALPAAAQGEVDLRITAKKGSSVWLLNEQKQEQNIDMGGQQMETGNTTNRVLHVTVKDVDDKGNLIVETKVARIFGSASVPMMGDTEFDSAAPGGDEGGDDEGDMLGMMTKAMLNGAGKTFTAKVSPFGRVVELMDDAKAMADGGRSPMGGGIDESTLRQMVEGAFGKLPEKPIAVGGKWKDTEREPGQRIPVKNNIELTLVKCDAESFEVTGEGTIDQAEPIADDKEGGDEGDQEAMAREMMKSMKMKNGKASGAIKVSRTDSFVLTGNQVITMDIDMSAGPMGDMQMTMKMTNGWKRATEADAAPKKDEKPAEKPAEKKDGEVKEAGK
jgi:hypothetical protein